MDNFGASIFGLAKNNNGFFKSEKQASFLISQLSQFDGYVTNADSGYNTCPIFAEWDAKGITKLIKHSNTKKGLVCVLMFERKEGSKLTEIEIKQLASLTRKVKGLEKDLTEYVQSFHNGTYSKRKDENGQYFPDTVETYYKGVSRRESEIASIKQYIAEKYNG
jgi:hypothetical protein